MKRLGLYQCWIPTRDFHTPYKLTPAEAQRILLRARGQVDKNICLHPEVVSFCDQVKEEINHGLIRITWPGEL
ncbi:hypothetical protein BGX28_000666 [Mortierella sp. GBA30]|nr:hypothetical protein BGX28_000666 [Mortierella sp. GBA30]